MRCSGKSTTWRGNRVAAAALVLAVCGTGAGAESDVAVSDDVVRAAIVRAVRNRMGPDARVAVDDLRVRGSLGEATGIIASLDPSARLGIVTRVALKGLRGRGHAIRVGEAECRVRVSLPYLEVLVPVARGEMLPAGAVRLVHGTPIDVPLRPLPTDAAGARALRPLTPGDLVQEHDIQVPPAVRSGDTVQVRVKASDLVVTLDAVAAQDGRVGDRIRLVNPSSGRALRGLVLGRGVLEVLP